MWIQHHWRQWTLQFCGVVLLCALATTTTVVCAQEALGAADGDRQAAGAAYTRGTRAYLAGDYNGAAGWFDTAYRLAPASAALVQSIRSNMRAGHEVRAATLALRVVAHHAGDAEAVREANELLTRLSSLYVRVEVRCADARGAESHCAIEVGGVVQEHNLFFIAPNERVEVRARFASGDVHEEVTGSAGATVETTLVEPEATRALSHNERQPRSRSTSSGLDPAYFLVAVGATAVAAGFAAWSTYDMFDGVPAYQANPTQARLLDGQSRELRTQVLLGVSAGLIATSVLLLLFTDWNNESTEREESNVRLQPIFTDELAGASLRRTF